MLKLVIFLSIAFAQKGIAGPICNKYQHYLELRSVNLFREYLRIDTTTGNNENLKPALEFWARQMKELGIPHVIYEPAGKPIFVATVVGTEPNLPSIMLNSHMDVVTVDPSEWKYPPFSAHMDENGDIYARGTQDTKDVAVQYLEAIRRLKKDNVCLKRTIHITLMPDEESGGKAGVKAFVKTKEFRSLNIGFALDEGLTSVDDTLYATFVDRRAWQMQFVIHGEGGHGFSMPEDSAMVKTYAFMKAVMNFRDDQTRIAKTKNKTDFTGFSATNINVIQGGLATNIIPTKVNVTVDMRLPPDADVSSMDAVVQSWMDVAGNATELTYIRKETESGITSVDATNPYWGVMKNTLNTMNIKIEPVVCPATSDMLVLRNLGIPALGFSTKMRTIAKLHGKDEYQNVEVFLKGIDIYTELIKNLANVPGHQAVKLQQYY